MKEDAISFKNLNGHALNGIVHFPDHYSQEKDKVMVILVHSGVRGRVGTGRQYVYYARTLARLGYYVFRFDSYGMGDSEGDIEICSSKKYYRSIQFGRYVQDTKDVVKLVKQKYQVRKIVLLGLCGGAITSLLCGGVNSEIDGLILLNPPVILDNEKMDYIARRPSGFYRKRIVGYLNKLRDPEAWLRFATGKSDYLVLNWVNGYFRSQWSRLKKKMLKIDNSNAPQFNHLFLKSMKKIIKRGGKLFFIYGDNDYFKVEFESEIITRCNGKLPKGCRYETIEKANHMLTLPKWQNQALELFVPWLEKINHG